MDQQYSESGLTHQLEAVCGPVANLMHSKFGLIAERVELQTAGIKRFRPGLEPVDNFFRHSLHTVLNSQLNRPGTFILLNLATQHAVACLDLFYAFNFDVNFLYYPTETDSKKDTHQGYDSGAIGRILEVFSDETHRSSVIQRKNNLNRSSVHGVVLNIHAHSNNDERKELIAQFPTLHDFKKLGIRRVLYLSEISPEVGRFEDRVIHKDFTDDDQEIKRMYHEASDIQRYVMNLVENGFSTTAVGIDTRPRGVRDDS